MLFSCLSPAFLLIFLVKGGECQIISLFSRENKTNDCRIWSPWGPCIWTHTVSSSWKRRSSVGSYKPYLDQLSSGCKNHWLFDYIQRRFGTALNNVFSYLAQVNENKEPCGMCSYRQSCGHGAPKYCNYEPSKAGRKSPFPFYVTEQVCGRGQGLRRNQNLACTAKAVSLMPNDKKSRRHRDKLQSCILWPSDRVKLTGVPELVQKTLKAIKWSNCKYYYNRRVRAHQCKCCCFPYEPIKRRGNYFVCEQMPGAQVAPGAAAVSSFSGK